MARAPGNDEPEHVFSVGTCTNMSLHVHVHGWPHRSAQAETVTQTLAAPTDSPCFAFAIWSRTYHCPRWWVNQFPLLSQIIKS